MPENYRHKLVSMYCYKFVINSRDHRSMEVVRSEWLDTHTATQKKAGVGKQIFFASSDSTAHQKN